MGKFGDICVKSLYIIVEMRSEKHYGYSNVEYALPARAEDLSERTDLNGLCNVSRWETPNAMYSTNSKAFAKGWKGKMYKEDSI